MYGSDLSVIGSLPYMSSTIYFDKFLISMSLFETSGSGDKCNAAVIIELITLRLSLVKQHNP